MRLKMNKILANKNAKKGILFLVTAVMLLGICGCGKKEAIKNDGTIYTDGDHCTDDRSGNGL